VSGELRAALTLKPNRTPAYGGSEFNLERSRPIFFPMSLQIPNDTRLAVRSINRGEPFETSNPDARIS